MARHMMLIAQRQLVLRSTGPKILEGYICSEEEIKAPMPSISIDKDSARLSAVDFADVRFRSMIADEEEESITTAEKLKRMGLKGCCALDAGFAWGLYQQSDKQTLKWLYHDRGLTRIDFLGEIFQREDGCRCVAVLARNSQGEWLLHFEPENEAWTESHQTATHKR